jgi:uncharacterized protein (DUF983 family)
MRRINDDQVGKGRPMTKSMMLVVFLVAMVAIVVGVDVMVFRHRFWERLIVNISIVLVFALFYLRFLKRP